MLTARQQRIVTDTIEAQLSHEPLRETRNRKRMRTNTVAPRELRIGKLRVYYDVEETPQPLVNIIAIGIKRRERVFFGEEEMDL